MCLGFKERSLGRGLAYLIYKLDVRGALKIEPIMRRVVRCVSRVCVCFRLLQKASVLGYLVQESDVGGALAQCAACVVGVCGLYQARLFERLGLLWAQAHLVDELDVGEARLLESLGRDLFTQSVPSILGAG